MKQRFTKHWYHTLVLSPLNLPSELPPPRLDPPTCLSNGPAQLWSPTCIICWEIDRQHRCARRRFLGPGRPQRLRRDGGGGHLGSGRGAGLGAEALRWLVRTVPARGLPCTFRGDRNPAVGTAPGVPLCPGLRPSLRSGLRTGGSGPGLRACARAALRVPRDAGPEARRWGGTRWPGPARAVTSLFRFAFSQGVFAKGENLRPSSSLEMAHVSHSWNNRVWKQVREWRDGFMMTLA